jgi:hypothetical protein
MTMTTLYQAPPSGTTITMAMACLSIVYATHGNEGSHDFSSPMPTHMDS